MKLTQLLRQAARFSLRDWRAGELRLLVAALVVAVAAVSSVGFLVDRLRLGMERDARQLLGADAVLSSDHPLTEEERAAARTRGLKMAETVVFPSMALSDSPAGETSLAAIKAVSAGYPLRGALRVTDRVGGAETVAVGIPQSGTVWVDPQLLPALGVEPGATLRLGELALKIDKLIVLEPDRGAQFINFAPRILMNLADLPATQLIQPGSRATYRLLVAGEPAALRAYTTATRSGLQRGQSLESLDSGRPDMQSTLERAQRFLALVALLAALIAAVAVAAAARRFSQRHLDACAMMRSLGVTQRELFSLFTLEFVFVGLLCCVLGALLGYATHFALLQALQGLTPSDLPAPSLLPAAQAVLVGLVLLLGFTLPALAQLRRVPPLLVLRKDMPPPGGRAVVGYVAGATAFLALAIWSARDFLVGALTAGGFAVGAAVFAVAAWLVLRLLGTTRNWLAGQLGISWRFALAAMQRRQGATVVQLVALAIGLMALLLLTVTRNDLINAWRQAAPADAPNRFIINIQPEQRETIAARVQTVDPAARLFPMVRGRLIQKNGKPIGPETFADDRAQRLVDREFNLSYDNAPPPYSPIVAGRWFSPGTNELSIESGIAKTLGIALNDHLVFDVAGTQIEARVTSLRKVNWDSMRVNFYVIMPRQLLVDMPQSYITALHLSADQSGFAAAMVREFPNLTVVDLTAILRQVQSLLDQVIAAVEILFGFTLIAGVLVLYAALASSRDERMREAALLRALGASRRQLARAQTSEMIFLGATAGLLAAVGATAIGWALARYAFEFDYRLTPWIFLVGAVAGMASALIGGWIGLRNVLNTPPLTSLREL